MPKFRVRVLQGSNWAEDVVEAASADIGPDGAILVDAENNVVMAIAKDKVISILKLPDGK